jgi:hypothetical protein
MHKRCQQLGLAPWTVTTRLFKGKTLKMKGQIFKTDLPFDQVTYDRDGDSWTFKFRTDYFTAYGLWRILENRKIRFVSLDNGHQFGLPKPIDLVTEVNELLKNKRLETIIIKPDTSDLQLILNDNFEIEIFITSSGYETYQFSFDSKKYIGQGSGDIAIFQG